MRKQRKKKAAALQDYMIAVTSRYIVRRAEFRKRLTEWLPLQCTCCGSEDKIVVDHVVPISRWGINHLVNMQFLCWSCNRRKSSQSTDYRDPLIVRMMKWVYFQE